MLEDEVSEHMVRGIRTTGGLSIGGKTIRGHL